MGALPKLEPIFLNSTYTITKLHDTYGCKILSAAYFYKLYL